MFIKLFGKSMELEILIDFENPLLLHH
jgi:hypothetical protein